MLIKETQSKVIQGNKKTSLKANQGNFCCQTYCNKLGITFTPEVQMTWFWWIWRVKKKIYEYYVTTITDSTRFDEICPAQVNAFYEEKWQQHSIALGFPKSYKRTYSAIEERGPEGTLGERASSPRRAKEIIKEQGFEIFIFLLSWIQWSLHFPIFCFPISWCFSKLFLARVMM